MNLLATIHSRWAADETLNGLLDSSKVHTGTFQWDDDGDPPFPFAVIRQTQRVPRRASATSGVDYVSVTIAIYHGRNYRDELDAIVAAFHAAFFRQHWNLSGSDRVLTAKRINEQYVQDENDDWAAVLDYEFPAYLASGV